MVHCNLLIGPVVVLLMADHPIASRCSRPVLKMCTKSLYYQNQQLHAYEPVSGIEVFLGNNKTKN